MVKLVALLFLVVVIGIILSDYSKMREDDARASAERRAMDEDPVRALPISRGQNDPYLTNMQAQVELLTSQLGAVLGGGAGAGVGRGVGSAVSAAQVESARGLASHPATTSEVREVTERSQSAGIEFGAAWGANAAAAIGGFVGALPSVPLVAAQTVANSVGGATEGLYRNLFERGAFAHADRAGWPKL